MKRIGLIFIGAMLALGGFAAAGVSVGGASEPAADDSKITICHASSAVNNPYVDPTVSKNSIQNVDGLDANGHGTHTGPVFPAAGWGDIIPPFAAGSKVNDKGKVTDEWGAFAGLNWTAEGRAIYENGCKPVTEETTSSTTTTPTTPTDVCPNIEGVQETVPQGKVKDEEGNCVTPPSPTDVCPNIDGNQSSVPQGYTKNEDGQCVLVPPVTTTTVTTTTVRTCPDGLPPNAGKDGQPGNDDCNRTTTTTTLTTASVPTTTTDPGTTTSTSTSTDTTTTTEAAAGTTTSSTPPPASGVAGATASSPPAKGTLPFTGAPDWMPALGGGLLLALGLGLRRLGKEA